MILLIDNYDSFTYNLVQYFGELGEDLIVRRNDDVTIEEIKQMGPSYLVISPGPRTPNEAGISVDAIRTFAGKIPIFGVCLGHQAIGQAFGGKVVHADRLMHGKTSPIEHDGKTLFKDIPQQTIVTRYHSLAVERASLPSCLEVTAETSTGEIMALRHKELPIEGVQFHPEAILTEHGKDMIKNFIEAYRHVALA
ncbi:MULTISPECIES: aminodeoxychorismate/anthranilate synthase component II [unclassified Exiguobacterium]|uniref:aminodeoxychorismate/anthranilate synthase component II n=1 Tax=unclassified Exiguobacterium TaxID=2644629 RepID=UPI0008D7E236|nr:MULTISPECIES: aminodeoxychorismate/anthranilate synthase component II [unclassified Exiguobacterium]OGX79190.1 anthranilate synthase component 2 [Exiguobacterium sp. SH31]TCI33122.1 aminodeoxychorismate/anthranilate synthase component II [Exiguobacterium sp. SH4S7]TCI42314.1 aminodeoxychorismate/anthranilate synthase component II [Exiguobacterium sp. SH5S32]TCI49551.1 aminodeoxychorismate/anthranilate synthase component II [Exiguobacterium sp. SH1S4]TCI67135.1 aminodeoxychorismate/anthranil